MAIGDVGFHNFPASTWRPSGSFVEFDPSQANTAIQQQRALLIGQITASGTTASNVPVLAYNQAQVNALAGNNSMLALMYAAYRAQDAYGEVWLAPLSDNAGGAAGTQTITITGPATAGGVLSLYVMGVPVPVTVNSGDTATAMASAVSTAIGLAQSVMCTASPAVGVVTVTSNHKGIAAGDIDLRLNYRGQQNNEATPAGVTVVIAAGVAGALNPVMTTLLTNTGQQTYDFIALPYTDTTSLTAIEAYLNDLTGRWSSIQQLYGHCFTAYRGTVAARASFGVTRNSQHMTCLGYFDSPTPVWMEAADLAGLHAVPIRVNPAQGVAERALGLLPPPMASQDTPSNRNTLLFDGISTYFVDPSGTARIDRSITMYQTNTGGLPDNSYLNTNLLFQAMYCARYINAQIISQFIQPGKILVVNGTPIPLGANATTPAMVFQAVVGYYGYLASIFLVQNPAKFAANGYGTTGTKGQVLLFLPFDFADQVIQVASLIQFVQST